MQYSWILGVLSDLETFAEANGLDALASHLGEVRVTAAAEISAREGGELVVPLPEEARPP